MTNQTGVVYTENKIELLWLIGSGAVRDKNQQENNVVDHNGAVYTENDIKFLWQIGSGVDCDENKIG